MTTMTEDAKHEILRQIEQMVEREVLRAEGDLHAVFLLSIKIEGAVATCKRTARHLVEVTANIIYDHGQDTPPLIIECNLTRWEPL